MDSYKVCGAWRLSESIAYLAGLILNCSNIFVENTDADISTETCLINLYTAKKIFLNIFYVPKRDNFWI